MKIICLSSYTSIWFSALPEAVIAHELQKPGNDVVYVTPGKELVGRSSLTNERILRKKFGLKGYEFSDLLTHEDHREINELTTELNQKNFENLTINGINIGKISLYEALLAYKKMDSHFTDKEWKECLLEIKNTIISLYVCRKILKKEKPDRILMYNSLYSVNHVWEKYARLKKIPVYFLANGSNLSDSENTVIVAKNNSINYVNKLKKIWLRIRNTSASEPALKYVTQHFLELLKGKHVLVYSSPKSQKEVDIRKIFSVGKKQKIMTATLSSYDEMFAADYIGVLSFPQKTIFKTQLDWIIFLIDYVKNRPDLFLIIRVHPREFPNKRENVKSEHARMLKNTFKKLPRNVKINWPTDNVSLYDLAKDTNVFLNAWSIAGVEMSLLGIPVVSYSKQLLFYPQDLNYVANGKDDYSKKIAMALKDGWSYERVKRTYRWLSLYFYYTIIRYRTNSDNTTKEGGLRTSIPNKFYNLLSPKTRFFISSFLSVLPGSWIGKNQEADCIRQLNEKVEISRLEKMLGNLKDTLVDTREMSRSRLTRVKEDRLIREELKKIYKTLYENIKKTNIDSSSLEYNLKKACEE